MYATWSFGVIAKEASMKIAVSSRRHRYLAMATTFLLAGALIMGMAGCSGTPTQYTLSISCTSGGTVIHPGIGTFTYPAGAVVLLEAGPSEGYGFTHWSGNVSTVSDVNSVTTSIIMNGHYLITANFAYGNFIQTWYDLNDLRNDLAGYYMLMNDLDANTPGYAEMASDTANQGKGWQPIGTYDEQFTGTFNGQGHQIRDLFIDRTGEDTIGLFGRVGQGGIIEDVGVVHASVTATAGVGGLAGFNEGGMVTDCYVSGTVTDGGGFGSLIGGLLGLNEGGTVSNCHASVTVTGGSYIGGLVADNTGNVISCYATGNITGYQETIGGLVGANDEEGIVSKCYASGSVTGDIGVGGLVGANHGGTVIDSYASGSVTGQGDYRELVGGLVGYSSGTINNSYSTCNVGGEASVGGLAGDNSGRVSNSYYNYDEVLINGDNVITIGALSDADFDQWLTSDKSIDVNERLTQAGGYYLITSVSDFKELLAFGQDDSLKFRLEGNLDLAAEPNLFIPYLAGEFDGDGHAIYNVSFSFSFVSGVGLFGCLHDGAEVRELTVENVNISGSYNVGGLVGSGQGIISNCHIAGTVTGRGFVGGLLGFNGDFGSVTDCGTTGTVSAQGEYVSGVGGLAGYNNGVVSRSYSASSVIAQAAHGAGNLGGLVGSNSGSVNNSYATGDVAGEAGESAVSEVGGLMGGNFGIASNSYATGAISGEEYVGGLVGWNGNSINHCYSTGNVTGNEYTGGLVGLNENDVSGSFWDTETSGRPTSDGGTGKTTAEMQYITTFTEATWDIVTVGDPSQRSTLYVWNIVEDETYPFLSWQPVS
jgi:Divergent InlB B-repeat domain/The GLUG motif